MEGQEVLWEYAVELDDEFVPRLAESSPPPFQPIDLEEFFGQPGPVEIEIGAGKGAFISQYATLHPERSLLGIEWTRPIAWFAADKLKRRPQLRHARLLWADANYFLRDRMPPACCNAFHVYFPDPWPKKTYRNRRIMQAPILAQMRRLALPGCRLHWGTDYQEYHESTTELLGGMDGFRLLEAEAEPTDGIMTSFEKKYRTEGRPIYRSVWEILPAG